MSSRGIHRNRRRGGRARRVGRAIRTFRRGVRDLLVLVVAPVLIVVGLTFDLKPMIFIGGFIIGWHIWSKRGRR